MAVFSYKGRSSDGKLINGRAQGETVEQVAQRLISTGVTPLDIQAAHAADCTAIGVATGKYDAAALREAGADHVLETLEAELPL